MLIYFLIACSCSLPLTFFSRHYDKMLKSLSKFVSKNPRPQLNPETFIADERIIKLSTDLGYNLTDDIGEMWFDYD